jgi:hypothetical protein
MLSNLNQPPAANMGYGISPRKGLRFADTMIADLYDK